MKPWSCFLKDLGYFKETEKSKRCLKKWEKKGFAREKGNKKGKDEISSKLKHLSLTHGGTKAMPTQKPRHKQTIEIEAPTDACVHAQHK